MRRRGKHLWYASSIRALSCGLKINKAEHSFYYILIQCEQRAQQLLGSCVCCIYVFFHFVKMSAVKISFCRVHRVELLSCISLSSQHLEKNGGLVVTFYCPSQQLKHFLKQPGGTLMVRCKRCVNKGVSENSCTETKLKLNHLGSLIFIVMSSCSLV